MGVMSMDARSWMEIAVQIGVTTGRQLEIGDRRAVSGGCINQAYLVSDNTRTERYFIKLNQANRLDIFAAEAEGLTAIAATATIRVPLPICWGVTADCSYLVLEALDLTGRGQPQDWIEMGRKLAALHNRSSGDPKFGWHLDNTIGATPQINTWEVDWVKFFTNHRLGYQLQLARRNGGQFPKAELLLAASPDLLAGHAPQPALVHGDLWGGNAGFTTAGLPVIFDPATYWGDREVDVAMTELFGGFPAAFYQGYESVSPLAPGYERRQRLYNLYHIVNHYNLFGGSYQSQANQAIDLLLA